MKPPSPFTRLAAIASLILFFSALITKAPAADPPRPPNIIFILADDIGYGDFGCYGATKVKTPHLDQLAREGIRLTDAHATASVCTPTRYSFITGQYAFRNPEGDHILSGVAPLSIDAEADRRLAFEKRRLRDRARRQVASGPRPRQARLQYGDQARPARTRFRYSFFPATGDRVPCVFVQDHKVVGLDPADPIQVSYSRQVGDEPTGREHPELLMKPNPKQGHADTIVNGISRIGFMAGGRSARWTDTEMANTLNREAVKFIEANKDRPFFLYFATHDIHVPHVPNATYKAKSQCGVRGDVIEEFDGSVARVLETLDRLKLADDTLVIVTSDNGGIMEDGYLDGSIANANGHRCNGALRGYKGSLWEGGHREPFIARWPGKIKPGTTSDELIGLVDMLATFAAVAGVELPADAGPDSFNVLPVLLGLPHKPVRDCLVLQNFNGRNLALRQRQWKFIPAQGPQARGPLLFDLKDDLGESKNLAATKPEIVAQMQERLRAVQKAEKSRP